MKAIKEAPAYTLPPGIERKSLVHSVSIEDCTVNWKLDALSCEFLQFLKNTSNVWDSPESRRNFNARMQYSYDSCLMNKLTAIGYLIRRDVHSPLRRLVLAYDDAEPSAGRTGKSLFANAIRHAVPSVDIPGHEFARECYPFVFSGISSDTRCVIIDDFPKHPRFTPIKHHLSGDFPVTRVGEKGFMIPYESAPRILATTNIVPRRIDVSNTNRALMTLIPFSSWYGPDYTPLDDFGHNLFDDWDDEQWSLFHNLMADCVDLHSLSIESGSNCFTAGIQTAHPLGY